jgi:hypothetical protein
MMVNVFVLRIDFSLAHAGSKVKLHRWNDRRHEFEKPHEVKLDFNLLGSLLPTLNQLSDQALHHLRMTTRMNGRADPILEGKALTRYSFL